MRRASRPIAIRARAAGGRRRSATGARRPRHGTRRVVLPLPKRHGSVSQPPLRRASSGTRCVVLEGRRSGTTSACSPSSPRRRAGASGGDLVCRNTSTSSSTAPPTPPRRATSMMSSNRNHGDRSLSDSAWNRSLNFFTAFAADMPDVCLEKSTFPSAPVQAPAPNPSSARRRPGRRPPSPPTGSRSLP